MRNAPRDGASHLQFVRFFFSPIKNLYLLSPRAPTATAEGEREAEGGRDTRFCLLRPSSTLVSKTFAPSLPGESASPFHLALSHHGSGGGGIERRSIKWD